MYFTVHDLLKLPLLSGSKLIAGEQGIKKIIKSISLLEAPDSINWGMPYDFYITNAYLLSSMPEFGNIIIHKLSEAKASGIGIKLNRYLTDIPEEMKRQANEEGFPIIILPYSLTPSQLISTLAKILYSRKCFQDDSKYKHNSSMNDLLCELLFSTDTSETTLTRKASLLGWDFAKSYSIMVIKISDKNLIKQFASIINNIAIDNIYVLQYKQEIIALHNVDISKETQSRSIELANRIVTRCKAEVPDQNILIGIGRYYNNILDLRKSYNEAIQSLYFSNYMVKKNYVIHFDDLGILKILCKFDNQKELEIFFADTIGKLIKYDQEYNTEYYNTAKIFVKCSGNVNETAKRLSVHYNTVKYRIDNISKILGIDLKDPEKMLNMQIGIKIAEYLEVIQKKN